MHLQMNLFSEREVAGLGPTLVKVPRATDCEIDPGEVGFTLCLKFTRNPRGPENFLVEGSPSCHCLTDFQLNGEAAELKGLVGSRMVSSGIGREGLDTPRIWVQGSPLHLHLRLKPQLLVQTLGIKF